jgi:hypothetical protein
VGEREGRRHGPRDGKEGEREGGRGGKGIEGGCMHPSIRGDQRRCSDADNFHAYRYLRLVMSHAN